MATQSATGVDSGGQAYTTFTVATGDTLHSIAQDLTLDPSYDAAIANYNGLVEADGVTPYNTYAVLPLGQPLDIPNSWLKTVSTGSGASHPNWLIWGALSAGVYLITQEKR